MALKTLLPLYLEFRQNASFIHFHACYRTLQRCSNFLMFPTENEGISLDVFDIF